jgi:hypothetical protein
MSIKIKMTDPNFKVEQMGGGFRIQTYNISRKKFREIRS